MGYSLSQVTLSSLYQMQQLRGEEMNPAQVSPTIILIGVVSAAILLLLLVLWILAIGESRRQRSYAENYANLQAKADDQPQKSEPASQRITARLEKYFDRNLSQNNYIFLLTAFVTVIGFGIIIWGITWASRAGSTLTTLDGPSLTVIAGIIVEFIATIILYIYRSMVQQTAHYFKSLERMNAVEMATRILDTMPDKTDEADLKSKTKAQITRILLEYYQEGTNKSESSSTTGSK